MNTVPVNVSITIIGLEAIAEATNEFIEQSLNAQEEPTPESLFVSAELYEDAIKNRTKFTRTISIPTGVAFNSLRVEGLYIPLDDIIWNHDKQCIDATTTLVLTDNEEAVSTDITRRLMNSPDWIMTMIVEDPH